MREGDAMKVLTMVLAAAVTYAPPATASYFDSGNTLLDVCEKSEMACLAATSAAWDMMAALGYRCNDNGAVRGQIRDVALKYLRENPQDRASPAAFLIILAGEKYFGCKKTPR